MDLRCVVPKCKSGVGAAGAGAQKLSDGEVGGLESLLVMFKVGCLAAGKSFRLRIALLLAIQGGWAR
jgi:hypothetical protein